MDGLWEKESKTGIFVDLLWPSLPYDKVYEDSVAGAKHHFHGIKFEPVKSNVVSTDFRVAGNRKFKQSKLRTAMEYYNQSLHFAEANSENLGLAYANRSACFFRMKKYHRCLKDIELAREYHHPKRLTEKLEERELQCIKQMNGEDDIQDEIEPKLSFDPDEKYPCMAKILEIQTNQRFGRHIVAKCDIDVGKTVIVEEPFSSVFSADDRTLCFTCMKHLQNFIPCPSCTDAMFCNEKCMQSNEIHQIACGAAFNRIHGNVQNFAQTILIAIKAFPTVEELIEFVGKQLVTPKSDLPKNCTDAQMAYGMFLKLEHMKGQTETYQVILNYIIHKLLMSIPLINEKFNTEHKQRFLMHLIWQHKIISDMSSFTQTMGGGGVYNIITVTCNIYALINHSCVPNLYNDFVGNKQVLKTIRPVKKGEQLFVTYHLDLWMKPTAERQEYLRRIYDFSCKCARCKSNGPCVESWAMLMDPNFQEIQRLVQCSTTSDDQHLVLKQKCYDFMRKFAHIPWSDEIWVVALNLMHSMQKDYPEYRRIIDF